MSMMHTGQRFEESYSLFPEKENEYLEESSVCVLFGNFSKDSINTTFPYMSSNPLHSFLFMSILPTRVLSPDMTIIKILPSL